MSKLIGVVEIPAIVEPLREAGITVVTGDGWMASARAIRDSRKTAGAFPVLVGDIANPTLQAWVNAMISQGDTSVTVVSDKEHTGNITGAGEHFSSVSAPVPIADLLPSGLTGVLGTLNALDEYSADQAPEDDLFDLSVGGGEPEPASNVGLDDFDFATTANPTPSVEAPPADPVGDFGALGAPRPESVTTPSGPARLVDAPAAPQVPTTPQTPAGHDFGAWGVPRPEPGTVPYPQAALTPPSAQHTPPPIQPAPTEDLGGDPLNTATTQVEPAAPVDDFGAFGIPQPEPVTTPQPQAATGHSAAPVAPPQSTPPAPAQPAPTGHLMGDLFGAEPTPATPQVPAAPVADFGTFGIPQPEPVATPQPQDAPEPAGDLMSDLFGHASDPAAVTPVQPAPLHPTPATPDRPAASGDLADDLFGAEPTPATPQVPAAPVADFGTFGIPQPEPVATPQPQAAPEPAGDLMSDLFGHASDPAAVTPVQPAPPHPTPAASQVTTAPIDDFSTFGIPQPEPADTAAPSAGGSPDAHPTPVTEPPAGQEPERTRHFAAPEHRRVRSHAAEGTQPQPVSETVGGSAAPETTETAPPVAPELLIPAVPLIVGDTIAPLPKTDEQLAEEERQSHQTMLDDLAARPTLVAPEVGHIAPRAQLPVYAESDTPVVFTMAGKGGVTKTTTALAVAHRAATLYGKRVTLIDMNRGQGSICQMLRMDTERANTDEGLPTIYDMAVTKRPETSLILPERSSHFRPADLEPIPFALMLAPTDLLNDPLLIDDQVYRTAIEYARTVSDLVVVDTQIAESADISGLIDNVMAPFLRERGAWVVGLFDNNREARDNLFARLRDSFDGAPSGRVLISVALIRDPSEIGQGILADIEQHFSGMGQYLGPMMFAPELRDHLNAGVLDSANPAIAPVIDKIVTRTLGVQSKGVGAELPQTRRGRRRLFGGRR